MKNESPNIPLRTTFRHMDASPAVEARARELTDRLARFADRIIDCHVTVDSPAAHQNKGAPFKVRIDLFGPGGHLVAFKGNGDHPEHQDVYIALRDAFDAIRHQLENATEAAWKRS